MLYWGAADICNILLKMIFFSFLSRKVIWLDPNFRVLFRNLSLKLVHFASVELVSACPMHVCFSSQQAFAGVIRRIGSSSLAVFFVVFSPHYLAAVVTPNCVLLFFRPERLLFICFQSFSRPAQRRLGSSLRLEALKNRELTQCHSFLPRVNSTLVFAFLYRCGFIFCSELQFSVRGPILQELNQPLSVVQSRLFLDCVVVLIGQYQRCIQVLCCIH